MTFKNQGRGAADSPELIDDSPLEEITSTSEQEPTQRQINDCRLAQAINYLAEEGGDDSPATFMDRVDRIDYSLLLPLSQQGRNFDISLFNRVLAMVSQSQLDCDEAAQGDSSGEDSSEEDSSEEDSSEEDSSEEDSSEEDSSEEDSSSVSNGESSMPESAEELPEYHTPSAAEALYRKGDSSDEPRSKPHRPTPAAKKPAAERQEDVRREHIFRYGGPNNEVERWYKNYPASLPFPETFQLAHWESIKIDYDLSESIKKMKAEGKIIETNVPFDHPALEQYKTLSSYESGSRFKLPKPSPIVEKEINWLGTQKNLAKVVQDLNRSNDEVKDGKYQYTPRVFLEKLTVGAQNPTTIRQAVNTTPTKSRTSTTGSSSKRGSSNNTQNSPAVKTSTKPIAEHPPSSVSQACDNVINLADEQAVFAGENKHAKVGAAALAARVAYKNLRKAKEHARSSTKHANLVPPASRIRTTSPVVRKISRERATSLERSPRRQSGISTVPPSPDSLTKKITIHPQVVIEKRPSGSCPANYPAPVPSKSQPVPDPIRIATLKSTTKGPTKRKCSASEQAYAPAPKRAKSINPSALKTPIITKTKTVTKKVTKSAAVGKAVHKAQKKVVVKKIIDEEERALQVAKKQKKKPGVKAGSTRSGLKYLKK